MNQSSKSYVHIYQYKVKIEVSICVAMSLMAFGQGRKKIFFSFFCFFFGGQITLYILNYHPILHLSNDRSHSFVILVSFQEECGF
jgi:hypothetical protein